MNTDILVEHCLKAQHIFAKFIDIHVQQTGQDIKGAYSDSVRKHGKFAYRMSKIKAVVDKEAKDYGDHYNATLQQFGKLSMEKCPQCDGVKADRPCVACDNKGEVPATPLRYLLSEKAPEEGGLSPKAAFNKAMEEIGKEKVANVPDKPEWPEELCILDPAEMDAMEPFVTFPKSWTGTE